jgi:hypothetical protein
MNTRQSPSPSAAPCCCPPIRRRSFLSGLGGLGGAALAFHLGLLKSSTTRVLGAPALPGGTGPRPRVHVGFCQAGPGDLLEAGWPGKAYDADASQALYTRTLERAATELGVDLQVQKLRLRNDATADAFLDAALGAEADGVVLTVMDGHVYGI